MMAAGLFCNGELSCPWGGSIGAAAYNQSTVGIPNCVASAGPAGVVATESCRSGVLRCAQTGICAGSCQILLCWSSTSSLAADCVQLDLSATAGFRLHFVSFVLRLQWLLFSTRPIFVPNFCNCPVVSSPSDFFH